MNTNEQFNYMLDGWTRRHEGPRKPRSLKECKTGYARKTPRSKWTKSHQRKCGRCGVKGHNKLTCAASAEHAHKHMLKKKLRKSRKMLKHVSVHKSVAHKSDTHKSATHKSATHKSATHKSASKKH